MADFYVYIDLETLPSFDESVHADIHSKQMAYYSNLKKPKSEEEVLKETNKKIKNTSFDGARGSICTVGYAFNDEPSKGLTCPIGEEDGERRILIEFLIDLGKAIRAARPSKVVWVGHNIIKFDMRFLWQRCAVNSVRPQDYGVVIPIKAKPWDEVVVDTQDLWAGFGQRAGLDKIAKALGFGGKSEGIDGSKVADFMMAGRHEEVNDYCIQDVEVTRDVYLRLARML